MWEIDLIGPDIFSKLATSIPESRLFGRVTSFGLLTCVLDKPFFSFLGTSSIKIFLLFLWNGHFNCLHFTSYMVCSMDIYWSGKDYFGTHLFVVYADNFLLIKVLFLHLWLWFNVLNLEFALKVLTSHYSLRLISTVICFL